jgi:ribosome-associated translation inhibitor RaiA
MAKSLNIVIGADIEKLREGFNKAIAIVQKSSNQMSAEVAKSAKSMEERLASIATRNPTMGSVRQLTQLAMEARALGPEFAQVANEIIKQAGRMKDAIADTRGEVTYFASDTRRLDAVLGGIQGVAGAFGVAQGAAAVFGGENKELQQTMVKLQGIMALVTGLQAVQNTLQAESAFMVGLTTAATKIQTYVLGQATVAARVYSAALVATGAGAIIAGLVLIYNALQNNTEAAEAAEEAQKKYTTELEAYNNRALKFVERQLEYKKNVAVKEAQLAGKTEAEIAKIELEHMNKRLKALKTMQSQLGDDSELKVQLTQTTQELENDIVLKGLDIQIAAKGKSTQKSVELTEKQLKKELDLIIAHGKGVNDAEQFNIDRNKKLKDKAAADALKSKQFTPANMMAGTGIAPILLQVKIDPQSYSDTVKKMKELTAELNAAFATLQTEAAASFAQFLADVATGDKDAGKNFGKNMLGAIAGFMDTLGKAIVATAIATDLFKKLIVAHPIAAAAAGIALMASAAIVRNTLANGPEVTAFADGGIVSGPTLGLMGEYPGASSNPEVIAPLDKLKGMLKTNDSSGFVASTSIQGRDLAIVLERYNRDSSRG